MLGSRRHLNGVCLYPLAAALQQLPRWLLIVHMAHMHSTTCQQCSNQTYKQPTTHSKAAFCARRDTPSTVALGAMWFDRGESS